MRKPTRLRAKALAVGALLVLTTTAVTAAAGQAAPQVEEPLSLSQVGASVDYLTTTYGISTEEALRRLELQRDIPELIDMLTERLPDSYAGLWLDQDNGGVLMVATTKPDLLPDAVQDHPDRANIRAQQVTWSWRDLTGTAERLVIALDAGTVDKNLDRGVLVDIDETVNRVVVYHDTTPEGTAKATSVKARQAISAEGDRVEVRAMQTPLENRAGPAPFLRTGACHSIMCLPPMRAGVRLDIQRHTEDPGNPLNFTWGACTNGFNVEATRGPNAGSVYTMTAAHCILGANHVGIDTSWSSGLPVGVEDPRLTVENNAVDFAFMPYSAGRADFWMYDHRGEGWNLFHAHCRPDQPPNAPACGSGEHAILGVVPNNEQVPGMVVCASGSATEFTGGNGWFPGTRCGRVIGPPLTHITTNICSRPGDSGGPLVEQTTVRALGILRDGTTDVQGPCPDASPSEISRYTNVISALAWANQFIDTNAGFQIITRP